jgi:DNA-binding XRE family transcriptional regulator
LLADFLTKSKLIKRILLEDYSAQLFWRHANSLLAVEGNLKEIFGYVLRELRENQGVSQQSVADNCDLERGFISRLERGLVQPTLTTIFKLAEFFEMPPEDLVKLVTERARNRKAAR